MTFTKNTIAATFAAVLIAGLTSNPAFAVDPTYGWTDLSSVTHEGSAAGDTTQVGRTSGEFGRNDISEITNGSLPLGVKPLVQASSDQAYNRNDLTAVTHRFN